ncbi:MAG: M18 family aminopeptidase [Nocardioidaceae bacterium]
MAPDVPAPFSRATSSPTSVDDSAREHARGLCAFVDASPSPFHAVAEAARVLDGAGFARLCERDAWTHGPGRFYIERAGTLVAWAEPEEAEPTTRFRVVGAHTDSPNLRVKQHPDLVRAGWQVVGLEPYGGAWIHTWLDRDLGLSGRLAVRHGTTVREVLLRVDEPVLRVPSLAIHLSEDRKGVELNPQRQLDAVLGAGSEKASLVDLVAARADVAATDIVGWDLMTHDLTPSRLAGPAQDLLSAPRLDNQGTCWSGLQAMVGAVDDLDRAGTVVRPVLVLFDHEEVGSMSERGAFSDVLSSVLERIVLIAGGGREDVLRALAGSVLASGDMAHATHPNHVDRHEPAHQIQVNGGPVLKVNVGLRYATDSVGAGTFTLACEQAGVPLQRYVHRADLPCGSTIGPIASARAGLRTVDVGAPQLAMHSARELMGAADPAMYTAALAAFLRPRG